MGRTSQIQIKTLFPGTTLDRSTLDLEQVNSPSREGIERVVQRARLVWKFDDQRQLVGPFRKLRGWREQQEASVILAAVFQVFTENHSAVLFCRPFSGDRGAGWIALRDDSGHAASGIFGGDAANA